MELYTLSFLRKGCENMKKIITICSAVLLISCVAVLFYGCGAKDEEVITTTMPFTTEVTTTEPVTPETNEGMITDTSEKDDNGVIGDMVTDMSEGMSEVVTDVSEGISEIIE